MNDFSDQQLLRDYAARRSEPAFAELVRRHVDHVHSAALRMVRDAHLAEDVTQGAFVALAQNAGSLTDHAVLSGWLHRTAQNLAANAVRTEVRRRARETEAVAMNEILESDASWEHIAPHLDAALGELGEADRDALLLRYFERKSASEMARTLGISDEAAQKRVNRAEEKLRDIFAKQKITVGAGGLAVVIGANAVQAAPAGLAATISAAAVLTGTVVHTTTLIAATKTIAMTTLQKTIVTGALAIVFGAGIYEARQAAQLREQIQALQQSQTPLAEQMRQLQRERDDATNRAADLRDELSKANSNYLELLKLRGEIGMLRRQVLEKKSQTNLTRPHPVEPVQSAAHQPGAFISMDQLVFAGYATPEAAFESANWAIYHGSYEQVVDSFMQTGTGLVDKDKFEANQTQAAAEFGGIQIVAAKSLSDKMVELKVRQSFTPEAGNPLRTPQTLEHIK